MIREQYFRVKKDGTASKECYCRHPELIENYNRAIVDETQTWCCHHRLETHNSDGERRLVDISKAELIALGMYFDRPPEELIFLTGAEHRSLHCKGKKYGTCSEETKAKISAANKGKKKPPRSEEHKRKLSEIHKGMHPSVETRAKMSVVRKGSHWFNNGITNIHTFECPEGFVPGRLKR